MNELVSDAAPRELELRAPLPLERHPVAAYLASLAPGSRRSMQTALEVMAQMLSGNRLSLWTLDWAALRFQHVGALRAALSERYAPASANHRLAALRGVLRAAWELEQMPTEAFHRAIHFKPVRGESPPRGRALAPGELGALFAMCARESDAHPARRAINARDAALLGVLYGLGLRRSEAVALEVGDYNAESGALTVVRGKGRKARLGYASGGARRALDAWLRVRIEAGLGDAEPLLLPVRRGGHIENRALTDQAVLVILRRRALEAGVGEFSPHDLRRTFISDLLEAGADISTVQKMAGHCNVATTIRYDRRGEGAKQRASLLLHVPFEE